MNNKRAKSTKQMFIFIFVISFLFVFIAGTLQNLSKLAYAEDDPVGGTGTLSTAWYDDAIAQNAGETEFTVSTADDLAGLSQLVNGGNSFDGKTISLINNISLSVYTAWTPIGTASARFKGTFDGGYHEISSFTISVGNSYRGLFGVIDGGTVKNTGIKGTITTLWVSDGHVGGIAGHLISGSIINSYADVVISTARPDSGSKSYYGGIAGMVGVYGGASVASISNCYSTGSITIAPLGNGGGGIAGWVHSNSSVTNCYSTMSITYNRFVGGIAGSNDGTVTNCAALNPMVKATAQAIDDPQDRRVASTNDPSRIFSNNYGRVDMLDIDNSQAKWTKRGLDDLDGEDVTMTTAQTAAFWTTEANWEGDAWDEDIWVFEDGNLPKLKSPQIVVPPIVNAQTPTITAQPQGPTSPIQMGADFQLEITASVSDGGTLTYQWYRSGISGYESSILIAGAILRTYKPDTSEVSEYWYYCVVTNTNNSVNGEKAASVYSTSVQVQVYFSDPDSFPWEIVGSVGGVVLLGGGFAAYWFIFRKKKI